MHPRNLLIVTAIIETATGLLLLLLPTIPIALLLGQDNAAVETLLIGRIFGWLARNDTGAPAQHAVFVGVLIYDVGAAALLAYAGAVLHIAGPAHWPAVALHTALALWCLICFGLKPRNA